MLARLMAALLLLAAAGCGRDLAAVSGPAVAGIPASMTEASGVQPGALQPIGGRSKFGGTLLYLIPYVNNPDPFISASSPSDLITQAQQADEARLQPGLMGGIQYALELAPTWTMRVAAAMYSADATIAYQIVDSDSGMVLASGNYELDPVQGFPVFMNWEYGRMNRAGAARLFMGFGGGYIWYGEPDPMLQVEGPEDEGLAMVSFGGEAFGIQGVDVKLEFGHVWLFENLRHQWMLGLSLAYSF